MVLWLLFVLLMHLFKPTNEQVENATVAAIESSNRDSEWMLVPQGTNYRTIRRSQPKDAIRGHLNALTSYKIGKTQQTTDSKTLWPFGQSDKDINEELYCSQPWSYPKYTTNGSAVCECGSALEGIVHVQCTHYEAQLQVLDCYCMTYNEDSDGYVVGLCSYSCFRGRLYYTIPREVNATELNTFQCGDYHRDGQLCGKCKDGFAPSVYSYSLACTECSNYTMNWIKYIAVAFLPLTLFLVVIVVFRLSATSGLLNGFVLVAQFYSMPQQLRYLTYSAYVGPTRVTGGQFLSSVYGWWNLDFFRTIYPPFCLHPKMTTIQVLALDYVLAIYPLVLLGVVYVFVELHDHGCWLVLSLWKPFHRCFSHFRRQWDIRTSLVDAFATLLLLSYIKLLSVSIDLLVPNTVYDIHGKPLPKMYLYYNGSTEYFGREHLPFGITAFLVLLMFIVIPFLLLCLYPCHCFQRCLSKLGLRCAALHIFMDSFQGCYKNGTSGTRDCRYFAGFYLFIRIVLMGTYALTLPIFYYPLATVILAVFAIAIDVLQPYRSTVHNITDKFLILSMMTLYSSIMAYFLNDVFVRSNSFFVLSILMICLSGLVPLFYIVVLIVYWLVVRKKLPQKLYRKLVHRNTTEEEQQLLEDSLPDRIVHAEAYTPLIPSGGEHYSDRESDQGHQHDRDATY